MKMIMTGAVLLGVATAFAACGSSSKTSTTPAAATTAATKAAATTPSATTAGGTTPAATKASASPSAVAATSAPTDNSGGDTCKYLSASEASVLLPNPGPARVTSADTPAAKQTSCVWGNLTTEGIAIIVNDIKISAAIDAIKSKLDTDVIEKISGLGDGGGFQTKTGTAVSVLFVKGSTQVLLSVSGTAVNADAVASTAKKIAAGL